MSKEEADMLLRVEAEAKQKRIVRNKNANKDTWIERAKKAELAYNALQAEFNECNAKLVSERRHAMNTSAIVKLVAAFAVAAFAAGVVVGKVVM